MMSMSMSSWMMAVGFVMVALVVGGEGQQDCASKLVGCAEYLNSTTPPSTACCTAIRQVVSTQLQCLCTLYETPGLLSSMGINVTQALALPTHCNISSDVSACRNALAPGSSSSTPGSSSTPALPRGNGESGVEKISSTGVSALLLALVITFIY